MQKAAIYAELTDVFRNVFDDESLAVTPALTAAEVPEWDSFNHINLIVEVEQRFKIKFHTAELEQLHTAGQLADLIESKLRESHAHSTRA